MDPMEIDMDIKCELASELVDYIWYSVLCHATSYDPTVEAENGDFGYRDEAQDIFNRVLDIVDEQLTFKKLTQFKNK